MEWSRQESRLKPPGAPLRVKQEEPIKKLDLIGAANAAIEVFEICAATEGHVLTIVHVLAVGQHVGRCPAASPASPPPITITLFKDILFRVAAEARLGDEHHLFRSGEPHTLA